MKIELYRISFKTYGNTLYCEMQHPWDDNQDPLGVEKNKSGEYQFCVDGGYEQPETEKEKTALEICKTYIECVENSL